jgi:beta-1,4-mannosyl-glycoprotein beta-1,4-N-acetylglucosaminyltransferase
MQLALNKEPNPSLLDMRNVLDKDDIDLNYEPFVFNKKIIDCFIFYNELDLLNYRLNLLNDVVDYFVLVESTKTFVGKYKPLFYNENKGQFSKFAHKIIHIIVDNMPFDQQYINIDNNEQWKNETHQRRCISRGFKQLNLNNNDIIIVADVDEIPNPLVLKQLSNSNNLEVAILQMDFYYYNLNCKRNEKWNWVKICSYEYFLKHSEDCQNIRDTFNCPTHINAGWHLSYFGDPTFIKNKIQNFSHQELNNDHFTDKLSIRDKINNCKDLFERDNVSDTNKMKYVDVYDNNNLPPMYNIYLKNYYKDNGENYCFIHSCCLEQGKTERLDYLINKLIDTKCIDSLTNIFINNIGYKLDTNYITQFQNINNTNKCKFVITNFSQDVSLQEAVTINKMIKFSKEHKNCNILYIHTKGVRYDINDTKQSDWINMMLYFLLNKCQTCINLLNTDYLSVGCNYHDGSKGVAKHYSGNFWWAKSNHLDKLDYIPENIDVRSLVEFHLFTVEHKYFAIHNSNINHYLENYSTNNYVDNNA